jgi:hypothetical protein
LKKHPGWTVQTCTGADHVEVVLQVSRWSFSSYLHADPNPKGAGLHTHMHALHFSCPMPWLVSSQCEVLPCNLVRRRPHLVKDVCNLLQYLPVCFRWHVSVPSYVPMGHFNRYALTLQGTTVALGLSTVKLENEISHRMNRPVLFGQNKTILQSDDLTWHARLHFFKSMHNRW